jgi:hypothetical protein
MEHIATVTSSGAVCQVDASMVAGLVSRLPDGRVAGETLDDLVHDCCDTAASSWYSNDVELADMSADEALDCVHSAMSQVGSTVNNGGFEAQVAFLVAELGPVEAEQAIVRAANL